MLPRNREAAFIADAKAAEENLKQLSRMRAESGQAVPTTGSLQRERGKLGGMNGMIRCGSSQLNQKLEKMKSTPDLLGDFRKAVPSGENLRDYFMRHTK